MAFLGAKYAWNGVVARPLMPAAGETVNGEFFTIAGGVKVITIHVPALAGAATTVKVQTLAPTETVEATPVWNDVQVFNLAAGGFIALAALAESTAVTIPVSATGGGTLRLVASADQSSAPVAIPIWESKDG